MIFNALTLHSKDGVCNILWVRFHHMFISTLRKVLRLEKSIILWGNTRYRSVATFANVTYSYDGRYTLNGTFRYEGTNRMGRSRSARWRQRGNLSAAWNVHEEKFFQSLQPTLSNLTFKASYSLTADRGPADVTNSQAIIKSYSPYRPFTDIQGNGSSYSGFGK